MRNNHVQSRVHETLKTLTHQKRVESTMKRHYYIVIPTAIAIIVFTAAALVRVNNEPVDNVDTTSPVVDAGEDMTVEATSPAGAEVTLHGSATDADMDLDFVWSEGGTVLGTEADLTVTLSRGTHTLTLNATDDSGNTGTDTVVIDIGPLNYTYTVVNVYPHDENAFTQGLAFDDGYLYEGTGLRRHSTLRRVDLETGNVTQLHELDDQLFGEGIAIFDDKIVQLTWTSGKGFVYDKDTFELLQTFNYSTEGWGITYDGSKLIMSDGTSNLTFLDPETFQKIGQVQVFDEEPVTDLNELEYINGQVYANVWQEKKIAVINPETGQVTAWIDLTGICDLEHQSGDDVLNGIAYDQEGDRLFVTGKRWSHLYEIKLVLNE